MNIQKCQNYSNIGFNGWGNYQIALAEKKKVIAKLIQDNCVDIIKECEGKFDKLDRISPYHHLHIDEEKYGAFARHTYSSSFLKSRRKKPFNKILDEIAAFVKKENPVLEQAELFKKKISPILLIHEQNGIKYGWCGNIETLKDRLVSDIGLSHLNSKAPKRVQWSLNKINKILNFNKLFLDVSENNGELFFEIRNMRSEKIFKTNTRNSSVPIPILSRNSIKCIKKLENFLLKFHEEMH